MLNINIEGQLSFQLPNAACATSCGRTDMRNIRELRNVREPKLNSVSAAARVRGPKSPAPGKLLNQPLPSTPRRKPPRSSGPTQREEPWRTIFTLPTTSTCLFHRGPNRSRPQQRNHGGQDWPVTGLFGQKSGNASKKGCWKYL